MPAVKYSHSYVDIQEQESKCYKYFTDNDIKNREDLRIHLKQTPIPNVTQSFVEFLFSIFLQHLNKLLAAYFARQLMFAEDYPRTSFFCLSIFSFLLFF